MSKEKAEKIADWITKNDTYLATLEEYEIPPTDEEN